MKISNLNIPVSEANKPVRQPDFEHGAKLSQKIYCRDPYILLFDGRYYLYHRNSDKAICCRVSDDLENWSASLPVFVPGEDPTRKIRGADAGRQTVERED